MPAAWRISFQEGCCAGGLRPVAVLQAPKKRSVARGMPTAEFPSDHISLVADFVVMSGEGTSVGGASERHEPILVE
jgi:hypothetical protein